MYFLLIQEHFMKIWLKFSVDSTHMSIGSGRQTDNLVYK